jgi:2-polyprenyl-6-methoxyphenol hydroxylase-like FAD-dependent oxidoreductase
VAENAIIDVLVAGGGPVGLTLAAELTRYGLSVRVIDKAARRTDKSKAIVIWSRTVELMDHMGCSAAFLAAGTKVTAVNIFGENERIAHMDFTGVASPHPFALMLPQSDSERLLEEHLVSLGGRLEREVELLRHQAGPDTVTATLRRADGGEEAVTSRWLVGCDGAHSTVRHALNCEFKGDTLQSDWILADIHLEGMQCPGEVELYWHAEGVLVLFPIAGSRYRIIGDLPGDSHAGDPTLEEVQDLLDRRGPGTLKASDPVWLATFRINERKVKDYRYGRVFLAGDAAHIHSPAGGQGMNTGMQDACNLAWKLAMVTRGAAKGEPLLASYSAERSHIGDIILAVTGKATAMATLKGETAQFLRNHAASLILGIPWVQRKVVDVATEMAIAYPESPLNAKGRHSHHPVPGERAPIREDLPTVGEGRVPLFVAFGEGGPEFTALAGKYPRLLDPVICAPFQDGGLWLVRPDGYVVLSTGEAGWPEVDAFLARISAA